MNKNFKWLISLICIGWIIKLFVVRPESYKWRLQISSTERGWNDSLVNESNMDRKSFKYKENTISTWHVGDKSTTGATAISASFNEKNIVNIVLWTQFLVATNHRLEWLEGIVEATRKDVGFEDCRLSLSGNQSEAEAADAIVFLMHVGGFTLERLPVRTNWDQFWVYFQHEPPIHFRPGAQLNGKFNWTMTYRMDSDIYHPYSRILPLAQPLKRTNSLNFGNRQYNYSEWVNGKTKLATAAISNCKAASKRLPILRKLQSSGIPIDIYGRCGNRSIPRHMVKGSDSFWSEIGRKYKFYFAIENSICSDYVTEKFWRTLELGMVPIVMGRARYLEIAPPQSFIDLRDFPNPTDLKEHLQFLDKDPKAYLKFFEWRRYYKVQLNPDSFYDLCGKLKELKRKVRQDPGIHGGDHYDHKAYMNLTGWWGSVPGQPNLPVCISPEEFGFKDYLKKQSNASATFPSKSKLIKR